jgi:hypothetical protein
MKIRVTLFILASMLLLSATISAQEEPSAGFVITLKNGSTLKGRTLSRDASGNLRLAMTESGGEARSYAVISPEDSADIRSSSTETDSIIIKLNGGSELKCKEFTLNGDTVTVKLGSATKVEVTWAEILSISFARQ